MAEKFAKYHKIQLEGFPERKQLLKDLDKVIKPHIPQTSRTRVMLVALKLGLKKAKELIEERNQLEQEIKEKKKDLEKRAAGLDLKVKPRKQPRTSSSSNKTSSNKTTSKNGTSKVPNEIGVEQ